MIMLKNNDFSFRENDALEVAVVSVIGDRNTQEDCFGYNLDNKSILACVCDGMGGYNGGSAASKRAVETILREYDPMHIGNDPTALLNDLTVKANDAIVSLHRTIENAPNAGSTSVSVLIRDRLLYWSAVGDSRLYIWRKSECVQVTKDQNYRTVLLEKRNAGEITQEEFVQGQARGDALINYLGIGELSLIDHNKEPLKLKRGDQVLICTDGMYRLITDDEITNILNMNHDTKTSLQMMELAARKKAAEKEMRRDNMTVLLIKVK